MGVWLANQRQCGVAMSQLYCQMFNLATGVCFKAISWSCIALCCACFPLTIWQCNRQRHLLLSNFSAVMFPWTQCFIIYAVQLDYPPSTLHTTLQKRTVATDILLKFQLYLNVMAMHIDHRGKLSEGSLLQPCLSECTVHFQ